MTGQLHRLITAAERREDNSGPRDIDPADWADLLRTTELEHREQEEDDPVTVDWPEYHWHAASPQPGPVPWDTADVQGATTPKRGVVFYVDADNQSPQCAAELVALFGSEPDQRGLGAVIAGNKSGHQIDAWGLALSAAAPAIDILPLHTPCRSQAADVALIATLGARLQRHVEGGDLIVVVSRDDLLVAAAEHARAQGCLALAAYVESEPAANRSTRVPTVLLPAAAQSIEPPFAGPPRAAPATPARPAKLGGNAATETNQRSVQVPTVGPQSEPAQVLAALRTLCTPNAAGLYPSTVVGEALAKLGFNAKARRTFLETAPGIAVHGKNTAKAYRF